jgi:hypothetical protein
MDNQEQDNQPENQQKDPPELGTDYEGAMSFLANTPKDQLNQLAKNPTLLEKFILEKYPEVEWSQSDNEEESSQQAELDQETVYKAERKALMVSKQNPKAWKVIKAVLEKICPFELNLP